MSWSTASKFAASALLCAACVAMPCEEPPCSDGKAAGIPPALPPPYDAGAQAKQYLRSTFGTTAIGVAIASAAVGAALHDATGWGSERFVDRVSADLVRHTVSQSIEFGTAALLRQDESFSRSRERGFGRRARTALYRSLFVVGRNGDEFAAPRIAAAVATPWAIREFHPGRETPPNPWVQSAVIFGSYVVRSYWAEFRPEITRGMHKILH
jgi:hypothetical protein